MSPAATPMVRIPVGVVVARHKAASQWIDYTWAPLAVLHGVPDTQPWAVLREEGDATSLERRKLLEDHQAAIAAQIVALEKAHALLSHKITNYKMLEDRIRIGGPHPAEQDVESELATAS